VRRGTPDAPPGTPSYNVVLTRRHLLLAPRAREHFVLRATGERLPVNALGFAGLLLVKSPPELEAVRAEGPVHVLRGVGYASVHEEQVKGGLHERDEVGEQ
jgi:ATP adenylyltransferase